MNFFYHTVSHCWRTAQSMDLGAEALPFRRTAAQRNLPVPPAHVRCEVHHRDQAHEVLVERDGVRVPLDRLRVQERRLVLPVHVLGLEVLAVAAAVGEDLVQHRRAAAQHGAQA